MEPVYHSLHVIHLFMFEINKYGENIFSKK